MKGLIRQGPYKALRPLRALQGRFKALQVALQEPYKGLTSGFIRALQGPYESLIRALYKRYEGLYIRPLKGLSKESFKSLFRYSRLEAGRGWSRNLEIVMEGKIGGFAPDIPHSRFPDSSVHPCFKPGQLPKRCFRRPGSSQGPFANFRQFLPLRSYLRTPSSPGLY